MLPKPLSSPRSYLCTSWAWLGGGGGGGGGPLFRGAEGGAPPRGGGVWWGGGRGGGGGGGGGPECALYNGLQWEAPPGTGNSQSG